MSEHVILASDVFLDQVVLALMLEDNMDLLGSWSTDVRSEHDIVRGVSVHVSLVKLTVEQLDVSTTTVNVLLVLNSELDDEGFIPAQNKSNKVLKSIVIHLHIREGLELGREGVKLGILAGLDSLIKFCIPVKLSS